MKRIKSLRTKRFWCGCLIFAMVLAMVTVPLGVSAVDPTYADLSGEGKTYDFEEGCGTLTGSTQVLGGGVIAVSVDTLPEQKLTRVAGWSWDLKTYNTDGGVLRAYKGDNSSYPTGGTIRLNDNDGFAVVEPGKAYHVSFRYKVASGIVYYSNGTQPSDTAASALQFGYGLPVSSYFNSGNGMGTMEQVVERLAYKLKGSGVFNYRAADGTEEVRSVGVWYAEDFYFSVPSDYSGESLHVGFYAGCYTGTDFRLDDVTIREVNSMILHNNDGTGLTHAAPAEPGMAVNFPTPVRDGYTFGGWYNDAACTSVFTATTFTAAHDGQHVYAKWNHSQNCRIADFTDYAAGGVSLTSGNSKNASFSAASLGVKANLVFDVFSEKSAYAPLADRDGAISVDGNSTYAVTVIYQTSSSFTSADSVLGLRTGSNSMGSSPFATIQLPKSDGENNTIYQTITTGSASGNLFLNVESAQGDLESLTFTSVKLTKITSGTNYIYAYDRITDRVYELFGNTGDAVPFPTISAGKYYSFKGWYNDENFNQQHSGVFASGVSYVYAAWNNALIDFEEFQYADAVSRHTVGEDCSVQRNVNAYSGERALRYQYAYQPNYFAGTANATALAVVYDNVTYKVTFMYRLDEAVSDVQVKFLTANRATRWCYTTNYDEATYTIFSSDCGAGWKQATVYFTADLREESADALFVTFNPVVEGATTLYLDDVQLTSLASNRAVVAYLGKDGTAYRYTEGNGGATVNKPANTPPARFASFDGWYSDAACTNAVSSVTSVAGKITYVYSKWTELSEDFDSYPYIGESATALSGDLSLNRISGSFVMTNNGDDEGIFPLGEVENNTTYQVTLRYKALDASTASVGFLTASARDFSQNRHRYRDEGNEMRGGTGSWQNVTLFLSTAFAYTAGDNGDVYGGTLFVCLGGHTQIENVVLTKVEVLSNRGVSILTDEAANAAGKQAMRFYYGYQASNAAFLTVAGQNYTLMERGVVFSNRRLSQVGLSTENGTLYVPQDVDDGDVQYCKIFRKTTDFGRYWTYDATREQTVFSVYLDGFDPDDTRLTGARGYLKMADDSGNVYTVYSGAADHDVTAVKNLAAEITDKTTHTIAGKNWNRFTVVHPKCMSYIYGMEIEALQSYAAEKGVALPDVTEKAATKTYEIVVGETTRPSTQWVARPSGDNYIIKAIGTRVIIRGGSDLALMKALQDFLDLLKLKDSLGCGLDISDGFVMTGAYVPSSSTYVAKLTEDFDGDTLDPIWGSYGGYGQGWPYTKCVLGGTCAVRKYGDDPVVTQSGRTVSLLRVEDGLLKMGSAYVQPTDPRDVAKDVRIVDSKVSTFNTMLYQYGVLEFKVKLGDGPLCTSLWMNGDGSLENHSDERKDSMTEFDLIETYGRPNYYASMVHEWWSPTVTGAPRHAGFTPSNSEQTYVPDDDEEDLYSNFHTFTFYWTPDGVKFAFDGKTWSELEFPDYYVTREVNNIIIGVGMGSPTYGTRYDPGRHNEYYETQLDYIYLYQIDDLGSRYLTK